MKGGKKAMHFLVSWSSSLGWKRIPDKLRPMKLVRRKIEEEA